MLKTCATWEQKFKTMYVWFDKLKQAKYDHDMKEKKLVMHDVY